MHPYRADAFAWATGIARKMFDGRRGHRGRAVNRVFDERHVAAMLAVAFEQGANRAADELLPIAIDEALRRLAQKAA